MITFEEFEGSPDLLGLLVQVNETVGKPWLSDHANTLLVGRIGQVTCYEFFPGRRAPAEVLAGVEIGDEIQWFKLHEIDVRG